MAHGEVNDELVKRVQARVYLGKMGFIALHSGHHSKPFKAIVGTNGNLTGYAGGLEKKQKLLELEQRIISNQKA